MEFVMCLSNQCFLQRHSVMDTQILSVTPPARCHSINSHVDIELEGGAPLHKVNYSSIYCFSPICSWPWGYGGEIEPIPVVIWRRQAQSEVFDSCRTVFTAGDTVIGALSFTLKDDGILKKGVMKLKAGARQKDLKNDGGHSLKKGNIKYFVDEKGKGEAVKIPEELRTTNNGHPPIEGDSVCSGG